MWLPAPSPWAAPRVAEPRCRDERGGEQGERSQGAAPHLDARHVLEARLARTPCQRDHHQPGDDDSQRQIDEAPRDEPQQLSAQHQSDDAEAAGDGKLERPAVAVVRIEARTRAGKGADAGDLGRRCADRPPAGHKRQGIEREPGDADDELGAREFPLSSHR